MHSRKEIIKSLQKLGFLSADEQLEIEGDHSKSDPHYMLGLLSDLDLTSLLIENNPLSQALNKLASLPVTLAPMIEKIIDGIQQNTPLANSLVCATNELELDNKDKQQVRDQLKFSVHLMVLLEVMTTLMVNDVELLEHGVFNLFKQRGVENPGDMLENFSSIWENTGDFFAPVKVCSVDPAIWRSLCWRTFPSDATDEMRQKKAREFIEAHQLTGANKAVILSGLDSYKDSQHSGIRTNIFEAVCSQQLIDSGGHDNAQTGALLILALEGQGDQEIEPRKKRYHADYLHGTPLEQTAALTEPDDFWPTIYAHRKPDNMFLHTQDLPKEWADSYISWNMAFITTKFPQFCHVTIPKLLIPCTLNIHSENYLSTRAISLWLTINFVNTLSVKENLGTALNIGKFSYPEPKQLAEFMKIWGRENIKYARTLLKPEFLRSPEMKEMTEAKFTELFNQFMIHKKTGVIGTLQMLWGIYQITNNKENLVTNGMNLPGSGKIVLGLATTVLVAPVIGLTIGLAALTCYVANQIPKVNSLIPEKIKQIAELPGIALMLFRAWDKADKLSAQKTKSNTSESEDTKAQCSYSKMDKQGIQPTIKSKPDSPCEIVAESNLRTEQLEMHTRASINLADELNDEKVEIGPPPAL